MPDFKLLGDLNTVVATDAGKMTQGLGFPLRTVEGNPAFVNPVYAVPFEAVLSSSNVSAVNAPAVNTVQQIPFGSPVSFPEVALSAAGSLTFSASGVGFWLFVLVLNIARAAAGTPAKFFLRPVLNGIQAGNAVNVDMGSNSNVNIPFAFTFGVNISDGDVWSFEFHTQDSNDPGLHPDTSVLWGATPSATITLYKGRDVIL